MTFEVNQNNESEFADAPIESAGVTQSESEKEAELVTDAPSAMLDDDDSSWMYENTVTNLPIFESTITNLKIETSKVQDAGEPAWRVLERRREAAELKSQIGEDFFDVLA